jgi:hypothetical protein
MAKLEKNILQRQLQLDEMEQALPKMNGLYLRIILGNVNVSILNKDDKLVKLLYNMEVKGKRVDNTSTINIFYFYLHYEYQGSSTRMSTKNLSSLLI